VFRTKARSQGWQSVDWSAAWENWCYRGAGYDVRDAQHAAQQPKVTGVASAALGVAAARGVIEQALAPRGTFKVINGNQGSGADDGDDPGGA
jgi:hypothetical protein